MNKQFVTELAEMLETDPTYFTADFNFKNLETWDSINAMGLVALVDKIFGVKICIKNLLTSRKA